MPRAYSADVCYRGRTSLRSLRKMVRRSFIYRQWCWVLVTVVQNCGDSEAERWRVFYVNPLQLFETGSVDRVNEKQIKETFVK